MTFGGDSTLYPGTVPISEIYAEGGASVIWSNYIRYIGAGAVAAAGIISLIKTFPMIVSAFVDSVKGIKEAGNSTNERTSLDLDMRIVIGAIVLLILGIWLVPAIPIGLPGTIIIVVLGFCFCAVSSRMVGLIGSSNNPVSGMAIATLLITTFSFKLAGNTGVGGMQAAIAIGSIICISAAMAGDTSQDLKTGYILGATPKKQQIGELIGAVAAAFAIGGVMVLLDAAYGFGIKELAAPQATMMKMIIEGVMQGNLPWALIFIGTFIAVAIEVLGISALPVAIGLYLPLELTATIMLGGLIRLSADRKNSDASNKAGNGVLFCSGLIAGEGLAGIFLAFLAVAGILDKINISDAFNTGWIGALALLVLFIALIYRKAVEKE